MSAALVEGGVKEAGKINPNKGKGPVQIQALLLEDADLNAAAKTVSAAQTPHKSLAAPGLSLVLFADLNPESAKKARQALRKLEGVDAKGSRVNARKGQISAKLSGKAKEKLTVSQVQAVLRDAGIDADTTPPKD